jgi:hypothetical protein
VSETRKFRFWEDGLAPGHREGSYGKRIREELACGHI